MGWEFMDTPPLASGLSTMAHSMAMAKIYADKRPGESSAVDLIPEISKIGIDLDPCNMMHPFKSMTGLIGFKA